MVELFKTIDYESNQYVVNSTESICILWRDGEVLLDIHRQSMCKEIHDYVNTWMTKVYIQTQKASNVRRDVPDTKPLHGGVHEFTKMADLSQTHYGGRTNVIRLYDEVNYQDFLQEIAPQVVWVNKYYKTVYPKDYNEMMEKIGIKICGGCIPVVVFNFSTSHSHNDVEPKPALLGYYHGPLTDAWTGGLLVIPECQLRISVRPMDQLFLV
jgi:hypothetical protein